MSELQVTLPDGSVRAVAAGTTPLEIAKSISERLAGDAIVARVNGDLWDLTRGLDADSKLEILTTKNPEALEVYRHSTAHLLAAAVLELFPGTELGIGPPIENGFYYDFHPPKPFQPEDLDKIEARMWEIQGRDLPYERKYMPKAEGLKLYGAQPMKCELITERAGEIFSEYTLGPHFIDFCRGPHVPSTKKIKSFKLLSVAGSYWKGDEKNAQLQRVYGTVFFSDKDLKAYLMRIEEAEKRDHRRIGREMGLFHQQEEAAGMVFWHPKGWTFWRTLENYLRRKLDAGGYVEVKTPQLVDRKLWEESGHWEKFRQNMYLAENEEGLKEFMGGGATEGASRVFALKPMNCPCHVQIFNQGLRSYRELPLRMAEMGSCHRFEPSGALHGILRVRNFTQDDAHIFCDESQIEAETIRFCELLGSIYRDLGFPDYFVKFSDRPPVRAGSDAVWDQAEGALKSASKAAGLDLILNPGEGAFYGPKLEFVLRDAIGRDWQCGTLQVDFVLPERLDATYVAEDGTRKRPVMLHRAIFGSFERMIGILIENYAGRFPLWLAPTQAVVVTIVNDADSYANEVAAQLRAAGMRVDVDLRNEKINYKVREHSLAHVPLILAVGRRDMENRTVAVRRLGSEKQEVLELGAAVTTLSKEARPPA